MTDLDAYGMPAGPNDLDPTHLRALAARVQTLAGLLEAVQASGERRDNTLGRIEGEVRNIRHEVDEILKATQQFTPDQRRVLEDIIVGRGNRAWLHDRAKMGAIYASGFVSFIVAVFGLINAYHSFFGDK